MCQTLQFLQTRHSRIWFRHSIYPVLLSQFEQPQFD